MYYAICWQDNKVLFAHKYLQPVRLWVETFFPEAIIAKQI